jgi:hypothetical protein
MKKVFLFLMFISFLLACDNKEYDNSNSNLPAVQDAREKLYKSAIREIKKKDQFPMNTRFVEFNKYNSDSLDIKTWIGLDHGSLFYVSGLIYSLDNNKPSNRFEVFFENDSINDTYFLKYSKILDY